MLRAEAARDAEISGPLADDTIDFWAARATGPTKSMIDIFQQHLPHISREASKVASFSSYFYAATMFSRHRRSINDAFPLEEIFAGCYRNSHILS